MEQWKEISDTGGRYEISNMGKVRSVGRVVKGKSGANRVINSKALNTTVRNGYQLVFINKRSYRVHQLVAKAFVPNPSSQSNVRHIDGNKSNNKASNLEWYEYSHEEWYESNHKTTVCNYDKLVEYAAIFVGDKTSKDLIHDLWLRHFDNGRDILTEKTSKRMLYIMVKNEYINSFNKKNKKVHVKSFDFDFAGGDIESKQYEKDLKRITEFAGEQGPASFFDYSETDTLVKARISLTIDSSGKTDPRSSNASKYPPGTIMEVYKLVKEGYSVREISEELEVQEQSVRNYIKKIKDLSGFVKINLN
jgi:DNA-directed RNA polymerase specialized sigma24 family protein